MSPGIIKRWWINKWEKLWQSRSYHVGFPTPSLRGLAGHELSLSGEREGELVLSDFLTSASWWRSSQRLLFISFKGFESKVTSSRNDYSSSGFAESGCTCLHSPLGHLPTIICFPRVLRPSCSEPTVLPVGWNRKPWDSASLSTLRWNACASLKFPMPAKCSSHAEFFVLSHHHAVAHTSKPVYSVPSLEYFWAVSFGQLLGSLEGLSLASPSLRNPFWHCSGDFVISFP